MIEATLALLIAGLCVVGGFACAAAYCFGCSAGIRWASRQRGIDPWRFISREEVDRRFARLRF